MENAVRQQGLEGQQGQEPGSLVVSVSGLMTVPAILTESVSGDPYPKFLLDHVREEWQGVSLPILNPDICLKVDSALTYAECKEPSHLVRQFLYIYHESADFDYEVLPLLVRVFELAEDDEAVWNSLVVLDFQRDCGMSREEYVSELHHMIEDIELAKVMPVELDATQLSA